MGPLRWWRIRDLVHIWSVGMVISIKHLFYFIADIKGYNIRWFEDQTPSREPTFIQDNVIPSISSVRAKPLSDAYAWDQVTSSWTDVPPHFLPPRPTSPVPQPLVFLSPSVVPIMSDSLLQFVRASIDRHFSFSTPCRALLAHAGILFKHDLIRVALRVHTGYLLVPQWWRY